VAWTALNCWLIWNSQFEQIQRSGTLLVVLGVVGIAILRPKYEYLMKLLQKFEAFEAQIESESAQPSFSDKALYLEVKENGGAVVLKNFLAGSWFKFEMFTIAFGTFVTGYGDYLGRWFHQILALGELK